MKKELINKAITIITAISVIITLINISFDTIIKMYISHKFETNLNDASSIGIIGGADGPTSIFVATSSYSDVVAVIFAFISIAGILYLVFAKIRK